MNIFRLLADFSHLASIFILLHKMKSSSSCSGLSFKSQALYLIVFLSRYLDLFWAFTDSAYNTIFKILFISSSAYIIYLMVNDYRPTRDPNIDTFKVQYLLGFSALLALLFPHHYSLSEVLWTFSIWLESVAILPQLFMLQRTGEADTITTHYLFSLGLYRALYIPNWLYRYFVENYFQPIPVIAGIIQTLLYSDFFYIYYTNYEREEVLATSLRKIQRAVVSNKNANCNDAVQLELLHFWFRSIEIKSRNARHPRRDEKSALDSFITRRI